MTMSLRGARAVVTCDPNGDRGRSRTHQSFSKDADINVIMGRYRKTGVLVDPSLISSARAPKFGDFSDLPDYALMMNRMLQAQHDFLTLPASVRARFDNDVAKCLDFVADSANIEESVSLKLLPDTHPAYVALLKAREDDRIAAEAKAKAGTTPASGAPKA